MATVICPNCNFVNPHGSWLCQQCYMILPDTVRVNPPPGTAPIGQARTMSQLKLQRQFEASQLPAYGLALYIDSAKTPLVLFLTKAAILGRADDATQHST